MVSTADEDRAKRLLEFKQLNEKIVTLEKALRLQTLTTEAVRMDDYDLACKSQKEATLATHQANIKDIYRQSDIQFAEICSISRAVAETNHRGCKQSLIKNNFCFLIPAYYLTCAGYKFLTRFLL